MARNVVSTVCKVSGTSLSPGRLNCLIAFLLKEPSLHLDRQTIGGGGVCVKFCNGICSSLKTFKMVF